ncbi:unnamed protein product [Notodromas monacha]|uniref:Uncharacterized protein n=1 Tax=Notodromas monacha TaxID=399045 RepID=A0A7R9BPN2_9CRUS|nr:unnamed protein product [Notodromas monacha]CAG0919334.1 unnamed protein product [Notodromas monacha]
MNSNRRRKKRVSHGIRAVDIRRGRNGFGFTISGQFPCKLSCVVPGSPADEVGLKQGDYLISVNGNNVVKTLHDEVVHLIGTSQGSLHLQISESYFSDTSDEDCPPATRVRPRYPGSRVRHRHKIASMSHLDGASFSRSANGVDQFGFNETVGQNYRGYHALSESFLHPLRRSPRKRDRIIAASRGRLSLDVDSQQSAEYSRTIQNEEILMRTVVGYLGTIGMPKDTHMIPNSRLQAVRSCIRRLRVEKKVHTLVLFSILREKIILQNPHGMILASYPCDRVTFCGAYADDDKFFGIVTRSSSSDAEGSSATASRRVSASSSCHVFMVDAKMHSHPDHVKRARAFRIECTRSEEESYQCAEFPLSAGPILQAIVKVWGKSNPTDTSSAPGLINADSPSVHEPNASPQPSLASNSSNSDSGIGFRDDALSCADREGAWDYSNCLGAEAFPIELESRPRTSFACGSMDRRFAKGASESSLVDKLCVRAMPTSQTGSPLTKPMDRLSAQVYISPKVNLNFTRSLDDIRDQTDDSRRCASEDFECITFPLDSSRMMSRFGVSTSFHGSESNLSVRTDERSDVKASNRNKRYSMLPYPGYCELAAHDLRRMFDVVWNLKLVQHLKFEAVGSTKQADKAERFRILGNEYFRGKKYDEALKAYNVAVLHASKEELPLIYSNRSFLLLKTSRWSQSLVDINRVLSSKLMKSREHKLLQRKAEAQMRLGWFSEAKSSLQLALEALARSDLNADERERDAQIIAEVISSVDAEDPEDWADFCGAELNLFRKSRGKLNPVPWDPLRDALPRDQRNTVYPWLSKKIDLAINEQLGRHLVARDRIQPGEVLVAAEPSIFVLSPRNWATHCTHCMSFCYTGIPCDDCCMALFCSEDCKDAARAYHQYECRIIGNIETSIGSDVEAELGLFARLRIISSQTLGTLLSLRTRLVEFYDEFASGDGLVLPTKSFLPSGRDLEGYFAIHCLQWMRMVDRHALYAKAVEAAGLLKLLAASGFFGAVGTEVADAQRFVGWLLFIHCVAARHQVYNVTEVLVPPGGVEHLTSRDLGLSITPVVNFANHACFPNAALMFTGKRTCRVVALLPVAPGEEVTLAYTHQAHSWPRSERRRVLLDDWGFRCECVACVDDWPSVWQCPTRIAFQCPVCRAPIEDLAKVDDECCSCGASMRTELDRLATAFSSEGGVFNVRVPVLEGTSGTELVFLRDAKEKLYAESDTAATSRIVTGFLGNAYAMLAKPCKYVSEAAFLLELCLTLQSRFVRSERL